MSGDLAAKLALYRSREAHQVKIGLTDIDGIIRGKYVSLEKFETLMAKGGGFCDCVFGWDVDDQLYDGGAFTGWQSGFPDARFRLLVDSERWLADEGLPYFIGEFVPEDVAVTGEDEAAGAGLPTGSYHPVCPRSCLRRVLARLNDLGLSLRGGFEYELFVFDETPHSVRDKNYLELKPLTPGNFGYSVLRISANSELFKSFMDYCRGLGLPLEGLHCETGPGVWEAALAVSDDLEVADRGALFKTFAKVFFAKREAIATFMAKWSMDYPGQSGHFHFSFLDAEGANAMFAPNDELPDVMRRAMGGLMTYVPEFLPLLAPTINSYTRLVKGAWAPTAATWGIDNRTAAFRAITGGQSSQHIECRVGGADGNPYLVAAATIGAAVLGIERGLEPGDPVHGNAYDIEDNLPAEQRFASTLRQATARFAESSAARELFGDAFVDHFATSRDWESRQYEREVTNWQLARYFEVI